MSEIRREKFAIQINAELLAQLRSLARSEARPLQVLLDEAVADLIAKHKNANPRPHAMAAYLASHETYGPLYKKLAE
ncbi:MAG TPA: hypothetical protein VKX25_14145 [Bryobacteraceae bacterium]|jgi:predicted transcriptional regulator|nr:hypothetical protein [Bryobacteraceae bacterium]